MLKCLVHGNFLQTPANHLTGKGCPKCGIINGILNRTLPQGEFLNKAAAVHGDRYNYSLVNYIHCEQKITIICIVHGPFLQRPSGHIKGRGCPKCGAKSTSRFQLENPTGWDYKSWEKKANKSKYFHEFKVYLIKCSNRNNEVFYKVGKTFNEISERFLNNRFPYSFEIIETISGEARLISELENFIKKENREFKYLPLIPFQGMHECFSGPLKRTLSEYYDFLKNIK